MYRNWTQTSSAPVSWDIQTLIRASGKFWLHCFWCSRNLFKSPPSQCSDRIYKFSSSWKYVFNLTILSWFSLDIADTSTIAESRSSTPVKFKCFRAYWNYEQKINDHIDLYLKNSLRFQHVEGILLKYVKLIASKLYFDSWYTQIAPSWNNVLNIVVVAYSMWRISPFSHDFKFRSLRFRRVPRNYLHPIIKLVSYCINICKLHDLGTLMNCVYWHTLGYSMRKHCFQLVLSYIPM